MNYSSTTTTTTSSAAEAECWPCVVSPSPTSPSASSPPRTHPGPCAACKTLRRRCAERCLLAPYFPPSEPLKFAIAHRVFGASNIVKLLQELPETRRADAVNSMVYEANARIRDPIYGCAGAICHLQKRVDELQVELARAHAEILKMQCQNANLLDHFYVKMAGQDMPENLPLPYHHHTSTTTFFDDELVGGPLWTLSSIMGLDRD